MLIQMLMFTIEELEARLLDLQSRLQAGFRPPHQQMGGLRIELPETYEARKTEWEEGLVALIAALKKHIALRRLAEHQEELIQ